MLLYSWKSLLPFGDFWLNNNRSLDPLVTSPEGNTRFVFVGRVLGISFRKIDIKKIVALLIVAYLGTKITDSLSPIHQRPTLVNAVCKASNSRSDLSHLFPFLFPFFLVPTLALPRPAGTTRQCGYGTCRPTSACIRFSTTTVPCVKRVSTRTGLALPRARRTGR